MKNILKLIFYSFISLVYLTFSTNTTYAISLDSTFGEDGKVITSFGHEAVPRNVILQPDGKAVVVGYANSTNRDWAIVRYNADGNKDTYFGNNGVVLKDFGGHYGGHDDFLTGISLRLDGKIVLGGSSTSSPSNRPRWTLAQYNS